MTEPTTAFSETAIDRPGPPYCHTVLQYFRRHETAVATVDDLAAAIGAQQAEAERQVAIRLHHVTLPRVADAGPIDYDARSNTARYRGGEQGDRITEEAE